MNVLIADDDVIFRTGLASVIPWRELGFALLEPAASAEEALVRLPAEQPDLLIAGIRSAGEGALALAAKAKQRLPELEVIFLTGGDDFACAREASRHVSACLPKTSAPDEIIRTVLAAKKRMTERRRVQNRLPKTAADAKARQLISWVAEGNGRLADRSILPGDGPWQVLLAAATGWGESDRDRALLLFAVRNALGEWLPGESFAYGQTVVLIQPASRSDDDSARRRQAAERIGKLLGCRVALVGGEPVLRPEQLHRSYATAREALAFRQPLWEDTGTNGDAVERSEGNRGGIARG